MVEIYDESTDTRILTDGVNPERNYTIGIGFNEFKYGKDAYQIKDKDPYDDDMIFGMN